MTMTTLKVDPIAASASVQALRPRGSGLAPAARERGTTVSSSLQDLLHAHREPGKPRYQETLDEYERCSGATVVDRYFSFGDEAAVLLSHPRRFGGPRYRIAVSHNAAAHPGFGELLRRIELKERQSVVQLDGPAHRILVQSLFSLVVGLLSTVAATNGMARDAGARSVGSALRAADRELTTLSRFVQASARRTALGRYLAGLPIGAVIGTALVALAAHSLTIGAVVENNHLPICLASGAIGAIISVMARVSQGERVDVDSDKTKMVTVLAGSFRPVIGAVFGAVLYVLICGGLLPLTVPGGDQKCLFFAGLAFVAGFTERWAQDTIVSSAPKVK
jgi:hypothetical protein